MTHFSLAVFPWELHRHFTFSFDMWMRISVQRNELKYARSLSLSLFTPPLTSVWYISTGRVLTRPQQFKNTNKYPNVGREHACSADILVVTRWWLCYKRYHYRYYLRTSMHMYRACLFTPDAGHIIKAISHEVRQNFFLKFDFTTNFEYVLSAIWWIGISHTWNENY